MLRGCSLNSTNQELPGFGWLVAEPEATPQMPPLRRHQSYPCQVDCCSPPRFERAVAEDSSAHLISMKWRAGIIRRHASLADRKPHKPLYRESGDEHAA